jgi:putative ABC transport system permease protein
MEAARARRSMRVLEGGSVLELMDHLDAGDALISEPLARRLQLGPGDTLRLDGRNGQVSVPVAGVFQDFSWDRGYALLSESRYLSLYEDTGVRNAALLLAPGVDAEALGRRLAQEHDGAEFRTVEVLRGEVMKAFNDTFAITYVLQGISTALALIGILTAVLCLHLERRAELGVLRALGARQRTVGELLVAEALILLGVAGLVAVPVGLALSWVLVAVVNTRSFGWSFPMQIDVGAVAGLLGLALVAGLIAGCVPWWMVRRAPVADLLEGPR